MHGGCDGVGGGDGSDGGGSVDGGGEGGGDGGGGDTGRPSAVAGPATGSSSSSVAASWTAPWLALREARSRLEESYGALLPPLPRPPLIPPRGRPRAQSARLPFSLFNFLKVFAIPPDFDPYYYGIPLDIMDIVVILAYKFDYLRLRVVLVFKWY